MRKEMNKDLQKAMEYVVYMMIGSYFKGIRCASRWMEDSLHIEYLEVKEKTQDIMEKKCIRYMRRKLWPCMPRQIWREQMEVSFVSFSDGSSEVRFQGEQYMLRIFVKYRGEKTWLDCSLLKKVEKHSC